MKVHVVPAIKVQALAPSGPLEPEAGLLGNPTRGDVPGRVRELESVQPDVFEAPGAQGPNCLGCDAGATGGGHDPVRYLCLSLWQIQVHQGDPPDEQIVADDGPPEPVGSGWTWRLQITHADSSRRVSVRHGQSPAARTSGACP